MEAQTASRIRDDAAFVELVQRRTRFSWQLTATMLVIYFGFILLVGFAPSFMAIRIAGVITLGFPIGIFVILSAIALTGAYVLRANTEFDALNDRIKERA